MSHKWVYTFGGGSAEGRADMRDLLGGKGANLAEMSAIGLPVPPGFTITTEACRYYYEHDKSYPPELWEQVEEALGFVERLMGRRFGDPTAPLLVSVRSGAAISMPGMMDTVLNLGINDAVVEGLIRQTQNPRFAWDAYRRFIDMFGDVVMGVNHAHFEEALEALKRERGLREDIELTAEDLRELTNRYKAIYRQHTGHLFPEDPREQLDRAIRAVFESWNSERAIKYRQINKIRGLLGTAVNVQTMVFGNMGESSGTGVCFTRNPSTGERELYGEYLINAQGEDVVAGIRTPLPIAALKAQMPEVYEQLWEIAALLERHYKNMQDIEFTVQEARLYILQTRHGKRTGPAAVKIAVDMVREGLVSPEEAVRNLVEPRHIDQLLHPRFRDEEAYRKAGRVVGRGLPASPGAAVGRAVFSAEDAEAWRARGERVILVRIETSPEDVGGMHAAEGILTSRGGMTSHAAVVARGWGKPCVAGCGDIVIDYAARSFTNGQVTVREGDWISINGTTGEVILGAEELVQPEMSGDFATFMSWADQFRTLRVRTNADTPEDARLARRFGAEGIGLCRTEHMFFEGDRIWAMREMILAQDEAGRRRALAKLLPMQREDFYAIFREMEGLPVTIRLLDPPLHEFLPQEPEQQREMAERLGVSPEQVRARVQALHELNPMLGHRGCRLGITYPEITEMQARAIMEAACRMAKEGRAVYPEIMVPLVGTPEELRHQRELIERVAAEVMREQGVQVSYLVGTMIEVPRAALVADQIAEEAQFFSFGTNDLTQLTFGYSRDDAGKFLPQYLEGKILPDDPFQTLDQAGVGQLVQMATERGRRTRPELKVGICGEHGGDPASVEFFFNVGLDYVSCSPYRVPVARLAAAQAALKRKPIAAVLGEA
ncbi:MAG: pyruvate, phosphate dikinase [Bacteroidota bacterium]|nr:pyruvate, phosphate dikinase [Rhodothermia bacterium]MDW8284706.1 pyruvate, phosphate dikinase [Bacteroidota bacterium]